MRSQMTDVAPLVRAGPSGRAPTNIGHVCIDDYEARPQVGNHPLSPLFWDNF
jgi:hypothetical protein